MDIHSIYVHIPFCTRKCDYCNFFSVPIKREFDYSCYIDALLKELLSFDLNLDKLKTCYIGGGSPSAIPHKELMRLLYGILEIVGNVDEFSIEVNPSQVSLVELKDFKDAGVNRLSIGAQSFFDDELSLLTRPYKAKTIVEVYDNAVSAGFTNISLDLIFALPKQSLSRWNENLERAIELSPQHISAYSLSYEKGTKFFDKLNKSEFKRVNEDLERQMYELTISKLSQAGFEQYEISNFSKQGFRCDHNLSYWYNRSYIGLGAGASSSYDSKRIDNVCDIDKYIQLIEAKKRATGNTTHISDKDFLCESAVLMLRLREGINLKLFKEITGKDIYDVFAQTIKYHIRQGNLVEKDGYLFLSESSLAIGDSVFCDFCDF